MLTETIESGTLHKTIAKRNIAALAPADMPNGGFVESVEEGLCILGYTSSSFHWQIADLPIQADLWLLLWFEGDSNPVKMRAFHTWDEWSDYISQGLISPFITIMLSRKWIDGLACVCEKGSRKVEGSSWIGSIPFQTSLPYGREMLNDLLQVRVSPFERNLKIRKWVYVVVDAFVSRANALNGVEGKSRVEGFELERIAAHLIADFQEIPPTVEDLARSVAMSTTKFKSLFKQLYGMAVYEFYQLHRMRFANELLISGQYSIQEVGRKIGYQNMSHFAAAFKKVQGKLPSQVLG